MAETGESDVLARLYATIEARGRAGVGREVVIAAAGKRAEVVTESADLLYHLLVAWAEAGVAPEDVWAELARREGVSGIAEKQARREGNADGV